MSNEDRDAAYNFLQEKNPAYVVDAINFQNNKSNKIPESFWSEKVLGLTPSAWWEAVRPFGCFGDGFIDLAVTLSEIPPSSGAIERNFSTLSDIMTKKRNKLGAEKAGKLCGIYRVLSTTAPTVFESEDED